MAERDEVDTCNSDSVLRTLAPAVVCSVMCGGGVPGDCEITAASAGQ